MALQTFCPSCRVMHTFVDSLYGKKVQCKNCAKTFFAGQPEKGLAEPSRPEEGVAAGVPDVSPQRRPKSERRDVDDDEFDQRPLRRRAEEERPRPARSGVGLAVGIVLGLLGPALIGVVVLVLVLRDQAPPPQDAPVAPIPPVALRPPENPPPNPVPNVPPPKAPAEELKPVLAPQPPDGKRVRVLLLLKPVSKNDIAQLTFHEVAPDSKNPLFQIDNVQVTEGEGVPAGTYINHRYSIKYAGLAATIKGLGTRARGPFCSSQVPAGTEILNIRKLGACRVDLRHGAFAQQNVPFNVYEGFYEKR